MDRIKLKRHKVVAALALVAWLATLHYFVDDLGSYRDRPRTSGAASRRALQSGEPPSPPAPFDVCGRAAGFHAESWALQQKYAACPPIDRENSILILAGRGTWGRTGNQIRSLLYALQYARDNGIHLGIMYDSWAMRVLLDFFFAGGNDGTGHDAGWRGQVERALCVEVFRRPEEFRGRRVISKSQKDLFKTTSKIPIDELVASQLQILRTLFRNHNTGEGRDQRGKPARDMCSGIDALFGGAGGDAEGGTEHPSADGSPPALPADPRADPPWTAEEHDLFLRGLAHFGAPSRRTFNRVASVMFAGTRSADQVRAHWTEHHARRDDPDYLPHEPGSPELRTSYDPRSAAYSVVHLRHFEGNGAHHLARTAERSGCDPTAALEMAPEYVKSILAPLGMLGHPIVVITDGQNRRALERLRSDPELGPTVRTVPLGARWFGGDVALAVMANAFVGNPSSTMSGFIARSRVALGHGNNVMHMAEDERGEWSPACGPLCLFRYPKKEDVSTGNETRVSLLYVPPQKSVSSAERWRRAREAFERRREASGEVPSELRGIAAASKVYTGLHPDEVMAQSD